MIRIIKPSQAPQILRNQGNRRKATYCRNFDLHRADYERGERNFSFDGAIYGHSSVKLALIEAQHGKCCFCETKVGRDGDVEHFRPKAGACQQASQALLKPGYYWLAYDWDNLLLCCSACNQRQKGNLFPLSNPAARARCHHDKVGDEEPLFIHPAHDVPEQLIGFREEIPFPINNDLRAKRTIAALGLDREILNERRRDRLSLLSALHDLIFLAEEQLVAPQSQKDVERAKELLEQATQDDAEFAAMARAAQAAGFAS